MRVEDYAKYINVLHDLAQVEDDLREMVRHPSGGETYPEQVAREILSERFGVDL